MFSKPFGDTSNDSNACSWLQVLWRGSPLLVTFVTLLTVTICGIVICRLHFHPLKHVPGPRLAAISGLYEFYYDAILKGKYYWKIQEMHGRYGPVVRISPNEVHVNEPAFFDELYNVAGKLEKDPWFYRMLGLPQSLFQTQEPDLHRVRRKPLSRFFTPAALPRMETVVNRNLGKLCERLDLYKVGGKPVNLSDALRCFTTDTIFEYILPRDPALLDRPEFAARYNRQIRDLGVVSLWNRTFPFLLPLLMITPRWVVKLVAPIGALEAFDVQMAITDQATEIATSSEKSDRTVIHGLMNSDLPAAEKSPHRVVQEAWALVLAGSETTARALETIFFYILSDQSIMRRLKAEVQEYVASGQDPTSSISLRKLPTLSAVIKEGLRMSTAVSGRLPRIDRKRVRIVSGVVLPPGTVISMSITAVHRNQAVYPNPALFNPERFIKTVKNEKADAFYIPFGRGPRMCLGAEFAQASLYLLLSKFLLRYNMSLFETTSLDVEMAHDMFAPMPTAGARGVRLTLRDHEDI